MAGAEGALWLAQATAEKDALARRDQADSTPWTQYQLALSVNRLAYITAIVCKYVEYRTALADAARNEAHANALAAKGKVSGAEGLNQGTAAAARDRDAAQAQSKHDFQIAQIDAEKGRALADAASFYARQSAIVEAQRNRDCDGALARQARAVSESYTTYFVCNFLLADRLTAGWYAQWPWPFTEFYENPVCTALSRKTDFDTSVGMAASLRDYETATAQADHDYGVALNLAQKTYEVSYHASEKLYTQAIADAYQKKESDDARADCAYNVAYAAAWGFAETAFSAASFARSNAAAQAEGTYLVAAAGLEKTWQLDDIENQQALHTGVANARAASVAAWNTQLDTAWSEYQNDLAGAVKTRTLAAVAAEAAYARATATADYNQQIAGTNGETAYLTAEATAESARAAAVIAAQVAYAQAVAVATRDRAIAEAQAKTTHDKAVVAKNCQYQDDVSGRKQILDNALDAALRDRRVAYATADYQNAVDRADARRVFFNYIAWSYLPGYSQALIAANDAQANAKKAADRAEKLAVVAAERQNAMDLANARYGWVLATDALDLAYAGDEKEAKTTQANAVYQAADTWAAAKATAEKQFVESIGGAQETQSNAWTSAANAWTLAESSASSSYSVASDAFESAWQENALEVRGDYEVGLYQSHSTAMTTADQANPSLLSAYQKGSAAAMATFASASNTTVTQQVQQFSAASAVQIAATVAAQNAYTAATAAASLSYSNSLAAAEKTKTVAQGNADADWDRDAALAQAGRTESEAIAQAGYDYGKAQAQSAFRDTWAAADLSYTLTMIDAQANLELAEDPVAAAAAYSAAGTSASLLRAQAQHLAKVGRIEAVGNAQITLATALGDAGVAYATAIGDAGISLTQKYNAAETAYTATATVQANAQAAAEAEAALAQQLSLAQAEMAYSVQSVAAQVQATADFGLAQVLYATSLATANADYQEGMAAEKYAALTVVAAQTGSAQDQFQAAAADAYQQWIVAVGPEYTAYMTGTAQANADYNDALARAWALSEGAKAAADFAYSASTAPLSQTYSSQSSSAYQARNTQAVAHANAWYMELATAEKAHGVADAQAERTRGIALAAAEKTYQLDSFNGISDAADRKKVATDDAAIAYATGIADADLGHTTSMAAADRVYATAESISDKNLAFAVAAADKQYAIGFIGPETAQSVAYAAAEIGYASQAQTASDTLALSSAGSWADFKSSQYAAQSDAYEGLAETFDFPWMHFRQELAAAQTAWWSEVAKPAYLQMVADANVSYGIYQQQSTILYQNYTQAQTAASSAYGTAIAGAEESYTKAAATTEDGYTQSVAGANEVYIVGKAQVARDQAVAAALQAAGREVPSGNTFADRLKALQKAYGKAESFATCEYRVSSASDWLTYSDGITAADVARLKAESGATKAYVVGDATLYASAMGNHVQLLAGYSTTNSQSYADRLSTLAAQNGTPWAIQTYDTAAASAGRDTSAWTAWGSQVKANLDARKSEEITAATAEADQAQSSAQAAFDKAHADAFASLASAIANRYATSALAALGLYSAPDVDVSTQPAETTATSITASSADFCFGEDPSLGIDGGAFGMFSTGYAQWPANRPIPGRLVGDSLREGLFRVAPQPIPIESRVSEPVSKPPAREFTGFSQALRAAAAEKAEAQTSNKDNGATGPASPAQSTEEAPAALPQSPPVRKPYSAPGESPLRGPLPPKKAPPSNEMPRFRGGPMAPLPRPASVVAPPTCNPPCCTPPPRPLDIPSIGPAPTGPRGPMPNFKRPGLLNMFPDQVRGFTADYTPPSAMTPYIGPEQKRLDYLMCLLGELCLVGDALWNGGVAALRASRPSYVVSNASEETGRSGKLFAARGSHQSFFPSEWPQLVKVIRYTRTHYNQIAPTGVLVWPLPTSLNIPVIPGLSLNDDNFNGQELAALGDLLHEAMHDISLGGPGHEHISPLVNTKDSNDGKDCLSRLVSFLQDARDEAGISLWTKMLAAANRTAKTMH